MDINFPLVLVILVFVSGAIWLLDHFTFAKTRRKAIAAVESQFAEADLDDDKIKLAYEQARGAASRESWPVEYSKSFSLCFLWCWYCALFWLSPFRSLRVP